MIEQQKAATKYIDPVIDLVRKLHAAYPGQRIELRVWEAEENGWSCYIELREDGIKVADELFYINPPGV